MLHSDQPKNPKSEYQHAHNKQQDPTELKDPSPELTAKSSDPGGLLKQARERLHLTQKQVALKLKLSIAFIQYIEANKFDLLPDTVFVRGYLRSYARLLQISETEVLGLFHDQLTQAHKTEKTRTTPDAEQSHSLNKLGKIDARHFNLNLSSRIGFKRWLLIILLILILIVFIFWMQQSANKDLVIHQPFVTDTYTTTDIVTPLDYNTDDLANTEHQAYQSPDAKQNSQPDQPYDYPYNHSYNHEQYDNQPYDQQQGITEEPLSGITPNSPNRQQSVQQSSTQQLSVQPSSLRKQEMMTQQSAKQGTQDAEEQVLKANNLPAVSANSKYQMQLNFRADTWIELRQEDAVVKTGIMEEGVEITTEIAIPFSLIIGKTNATDVYFAGKRVHLDTLAVNNVLRLQVDDVTDITQYIQE